MSNDNGGQAFPRSAGTYSNAVEGMTLRDYFAAKASSSVFADAENFETWEEMAERCYRFADAMLAERAK